MWRRGLISHAGSRPKASTGCSPPPLSGCDPDKPGSIVLRQKARYKAGLCPAVRLTKLVGCAPGSGLWPGNARGQARIEGIAQTENQRHRRGQAAPHIQSAKPQRRALEGLFGQSRSEEPWKDFSGEVAAKSPGRTFRAKPVDSLIPCLR